MDILNIDVLVLLQSEQLLSVFFELQSEQMQLRLYFPRSRKIFLSKFLKESDLLLVRDLM